MSYYNKKLVKKTEDTDKRAFNLSLTPTGKQFYADLLIIVNKLRKQYTESISGAEQAELKKLLMTEKAKIARNLSSRMLSYALGRSVQFTDEPALQRLDETLLKTNFNPENFIMEIVKSYPFRMKVNDFEEKVWHQHE